MEKINFEDLPSTKTPYNAETFNLLQTNVENAINDVVESGSNTNGNYVKYADGTLICTKKIYVKKLGGTLWGNNIYFSDTKVGDFAYNFVGDVFCSVSCSVNQYWFTVAGSTSSKTVRAFRPNEGTTPGYLYITAIGRWK